MGQSFKMQGLSPTPLSLQRADLRWPSNIAITWPQVPDEDVVLQEDGNIKYK